MIWINRNGQTESNHELCRSLEFSPLQTLNKNGTVFACLPCNISCPFLLVDFNVKHPFYLRLVLNIRYKKRISWAEIKINLHWYKLTSVNCKLQFLPDKKVVAKESSSCAPTNPISANRRTTPLGAALNIIFSLPLAPLVSSIGGNSEERTGERRRKREGNCR